MLHRLPAAMPRLALQSLLLAATAAAAALFAGAGAAGAAFAAGSGSEPGTPRNVYGGELGLCSTSPMTGYFRQAGWVPVRAGVRPHLAPRPARQLVLLPSHCRCCSGRPALQRMHQEPRGPCGRHALSLALSDNHAGLSAYRIAAVARSQDLCRSGIWLLVLGAPLPSMRASPGPRRDGRCDTGPMDYGTHTVCAKVTNEFLQYTLQQGNDLITPRPEYR